MADHALAVQELAGELQHWYDDPCYFVHSEMHATPEPAQVELLNAFGDPAQQRIALQACKGPGKTAGMVWCNLLFLATRPHPKMAVCSISWDNLMDNFWTELALWHGKSAYLKAKYKWTQTSYYCLDHEETWWLSPRSWSKTANQEQQAVTLAGLHAKYTCVTLDESGGMLDSVEDAAEGTLATEDGGEHRILQAGNPTHLSGPLYNAAKKNAHKWKVIPITGDPDDPKRSPRISVQWARDQIKEHGRDHDWVKVNVLGLFPSGSMNALLGPDVVRAAMGKHLQETMYTHFAKIVGLDPGRDGGARTCFFPRQGPAAFKPQIMRPDRQEKNWTQTVVTRACQYFEKWGADVMFIDDTGGWGSGILDGVVASGFNAIGVNFGGKALDSRFKMRRTEMHYLAAEWVKNGGALPDMPEIQREATVTEYWIKGGVFEITDKDQAKVILGESPDVWDSFILTFAQPVAPRTGIPWIDQKTSHARTDEEQDGWHHRQRAFTGED